MRISSRPRSKNSKNNDSTGRTTRSSSTPRSLRQSDLGVRRTQASGLKRDIADLKRQTKGLKKRSPVISRQARPETKLKIQQTTFMEEIPKKSAATNEDLTLGPTADATFIQGPEVSTNNGLDGEIENEAATVKEADIENESEVGYKKGNGDDEDGNENLISDSLAGIVRNTDENGSDEDEPVDFAAVRGNETMKVKRKKRRRRFVPKKKPKMTTNSVQEVENVDARVKKRGRRVSTERPQEFVISQQDKNGTTSRGDSSLIIKELQTSKGFVDKVDLDLKSDELMPMRRTPRMASLNAIAKVNAVLESYSPVAGKAASETREKCHYKKTEHGVRPKVDKRRKRSTSSVTQTDDIIFYTSIKGEHNEWMMSGSGDVFQQHTAEHQPISDSRVSSTSNWASEEEGTMTKDKAVQTVVNHKAVQTDLLLFDSSFAANSPSSCTCGYLDNVSSQEHASPGDDEATWPPPHVPCTVYRIPPTITTNTLNVPVCSSISTKTSTHTMAIPFTKTHMLAHTDAKQFEASPIISADGKKRMASLNAIAMMNAMKVLDRPLFGYEHGAVPSSSRIEKTYRQNYGTIRIPRINFQATSTSKFSIGGKSRPGGAVKSSHMKSLSNELEQLIENKRQAFRPSNKVRILLLFKDLKNGSKKTEISFFCRKPRGTSLKAIKVTMQCINIISFHLKCFVRVALQLG